LFVVSRRGRTATSAGLKLSPEVVEALRGIVNEAAGRIAGMSPVAWQAQASWERDEYAVVQRSQLDDDNPVLRALELPEQPEAAPEFLREHKPIVYVIAVGDQPGAGQPDERLLFVRKSDPTMNLERRLAVFWDDTLRRIEYPLMTFDRNVDLVLAPGRGLLALNERAFELLFRESPELLARTPRLAHELARATNMTPASEQALVDAAVRYARVRRRVLAIAESGHLTSVTTAQLRAELRRQGLDPGRHLRRGQLHFEPDEVTPMLRVLNEDLLRGGLSGQLFEVERKTRLP
jgi:hypothetical protein